MSFFRKPPASGNARPTDADPTDKLRAEVSALEKELAESQQALVDVELSAQALEVRAIDAIRSGDDRAARTYLLELQGFAEKAAALKADLTVLRATLDECSDFLLARSLLHSKW